MEKMSAIDTMKVLETVAGAYFSLHVIDLVNDTFYEYKSHEEISPFIKGGNNAAATMRAIMESTVANNFKEMVLSFSDLTTVGKRIKGKKFIDTEFVCKNVGWVKEKFILMETDADGNPTKVIHIITEIGAQKNRELLLERLSYRDALTGCFNRLAFNERLSTLTGNIDPSIIYISFDVNCLKLINDYYGHHVGDELIMGSAECLSKCLAKYGKVYRTGGDEFIAIIKADAEQFATIKDNLKESIRTWKGDNLRSIYISYGYAEAREFPGLTIGELAKISEKRMYEDKQDFYTSNKIDRRGGNTQEDLLAFLKRLKA